jgi:aspyridone synthetase (hybrid polyketide synthase/nonribosomal peptide synthetase)
MWRNTLRLEEMPWLRGHVFQSQILFPATGYIILAVDAAKVFAKSHGHAVRLIEVRDMAIPTALPVNEGDEVEIIFTIRARGPVDQRSSTIEAEFTCHSYARSDQHVEADKNCQGQLTIHLGDPAATDLPPTSISETELTPCNVDRFYQAASEIGFAYSGPFRGLETLNKCWGHAKGVAVWDEEDPDMQIACTLHPAVTDVAFQTGLSTILSMAERSMHSPYLPVGIKRAIIDPNQAFGAGSQVIIEAYLTSPTVGLGPRIETDISVKSTGGGSTGEVCEIQLEGVAFKALSEQLPSEDRNMYAKTVWGHDAAHGLSLPPAAVVVEKSASSYAAEDYERVALFYLRRLNDSVTPQDMHASQPHHQRLIRCVNAITANIRADTNRGFLKGEWLPDTPETIAELVSRSPTDPDMVALLASAERTQSLMNGRSGGQKPNFSVYQGLSTRGTGCSQAIAQLVAQISHTFPRTNILHLCGDAGAGTVSTVTGILDAVGDAYAAYTCVNPSQDVVDQLKSSEKLAPVLDTGRFSFDVFNPEDDDAVPTGKKRELYDVIIVTDLCRARKDLPQSIRTLRSLLRPGGFLISTELTGVSLVPMVMLGGVEGWWENGDRASCPAIKTGELDNLLSNNGFSGIDFIFHDQPSQATHGYSVLAAQAMDDRLVILRSPLTALHTIPPAKVVIIGGETSGVSSIVRQGRNFFRTWASEIQLYSRFDTVDVARIPEGCSVINLQDLDKPLFSTPPSINELKNLQEVLGRARNILWVTSGRLVEDPYANIMAGIGRALNHEHVDLTLQFLDFDDGEPVHGQNVLVQFLRLVFSTSSPSVTEGLLWVQEPELVVKNGQMVTPRVLLDTETNEIFNADRRRVVKSIGSSDPIEIVDAGSSEARIARSTTPNVPEGHLPLQVELSVALHVDGEAPRYLSYGQTDGGRPGFALSEAESSVVALPGNLDFEAHLGEGCDAATLVKVATLLIASSIVCRTSPSGATLVCSASKVLATAISTLAAEAGRRVVFVTVTSEKGSPEQLDSLQEIQVHPQSSIRTVARLLPRDANALFDLSGDKSAAFIAACLPSGSRAQGLDVSLLSHDAVQKAVNIFAAHQDILSSIPAPTVLSLADISQKRTDKADRLSVVTKWTRETPINAVIRGLDPHTLISPNKTYFLVGMAGELGQSLAYFLVRSGARYIVLSSRNPKDNQHWLQDLRSAGLDIRMVKMDVTDRTQVLETVKHLRQTMPPIGGVTNAALVLEPGVFGNLSAASIAKQMMPKIHGTVHLDEAFADAPPLDFFMCFGSLGTTIGNPGHAIYHAGNAFMLSLVANRKRRGLAGSILNFGMLVDVGYVARADRSEGSNVEEWLRTDGLIALSEADFHHVILQGIAAGRPGSGSHEVVMGVEMFHDKGQAIRPRWVGSPRLSHMVRKVSDGNEGGSGDASASGGSHQSRLEAATTVEEAIPPVTELLSQKIKAMIQVSLDSIHPDEPLSRLGIDSINAIEIRKWLWERLQVEIPMVKILGRDPSAAIIRSIASQYLEKRPERVETQPSTEESPVAAKAEEAQPAKAEPTADEQALGQSQGSLDSKISSTPSSWEIVPESPVSSLSSERVLEFTRSERLSFSQSGLFYIHAFSESRTSLNLTTRWKIDGPLDIERLIQAFQKTIDRHDALRTCFFVAEESSEVQQYLMRTNEFRLTRLQSSLKTADVDAQRTFDSLKAHEYSIETGETLRVILLQHNAHSHTLVLGIHNLAVDVVSIMMILKEIGAEYQSPSWGQAPTLSYFDYTRQQREDVQNGRLDASIDYWIKHLDPIPDPLPLLPVAKVRARQSNRAYDHHHVTREVSSDFVAAITAIGQSHGDITPMQFYLAALQVFLRRLLNLDADIVIGVVHAGRDGLSKFREPVGHMATILPIRFKGALDKAFPEVLQDTRTTLVSSLDHAHIPFALIVDKVVRRRPGMSEGNMPLIQVGFDYMANVSLSGPLGADGTIALEDADFTTVYDLVLDIQPSADGKGGHILGITCSDDYYSRSAAEFLAEAFVSVLQEIVQQPLSLVRDFKLFSDAQLDNSRTVARSTPPLSHSWPATLVERFAQVAAQFPDSVAIKDGDESITYSQLKDKVELYAGILLAADTRSGTSRVAVLCKPSIDLYAVMLAVYWIGAVFVPLDASVPAARRNEMIKACQPRVLVFHPATADEVADKHLDLDTGSKLSPVNITMLARTHRQSSPPPLTVSTDSGADSHILFTSGSTGIPKGIRLHQRGIMNFAAAVTQRYNLGQVRVLQQTSIGFDVGFSQIYTALANGGTLVVAPLEARGDPDRLSRLILENKVRWTMCTPSEYSLMLTYTADRLRQCTEWRFAGAGGEVLPDRVVDGLRDLGLSNLLLTNWYGPTEVTVITAQDIPLNGRASDDNDNNALGSTIGRVLPNNAIYIASEADGTLLPLGMPGEICVAGNMVANGYLDPKFNVDTFIENPFATISSAADKYYNTMYKTGDKGIMQQNGSITFLGRTARGSTVIKLRGLRIDLDEVSGAILAAAPEDLAEAAVTVRGGESESQPQFLVCHVSFKPGRHIEHQRLVDLVQRLPLPRYMIPATVVVLDRMPLVPNGKLDREVLKTLPLPDAAAAATTSPSASQGPNGIEQLTETEQLLRALWIRIIGPAATNADIGAHSSFLSVGGNSFLLVHLKHSVKREFGVDLPLPQLGMAVGLREMAGVVEKGKGRRE